MGGMPMQQPQQYGQNAANNISNIGNMGLGTNPNMMVRPVQQNTVGKTGSDAFAGLGDLGGFG
jgi:hypothetical protein